MYFSNSLFSNFFSRSLNHFQPLCCALSLRCPYSFPAIISCIIYSKPSALPKYLSSNNTLFIIKRHVVYYKTSRCLPQNDTLFIMKRAVVLIKSIHHGHQHIIINNWKQLLVLSRFSRAHAHITRVFTFSLSQVSQHTTQPSLFQVIKAQSKQVLTNNLLSNYFGAFLRSISPPFRPILYSRFSPISPHRVTLVTAKK